ncbi:tyrosine-type recombinase/integrase [Candidatus Bathyarchaeota archaeon]|nr:tyrosine-type recombinase/integrase [Candidatus Bathyarchaeota archaeon]
MPEIKTEHEDILRDSNVKEMLIGLDLLQAKNLPVIYKFKDKHGTERSVEITIHHGMIKCLVCLFYLFGKRISEVLQLRRKDVWTKRGYLYVRFRILKKQSKTALSMPFEKVKRISIKAQRTFVLPIIQYAKTLEDLSLPLFPGKCRPHTQIVKRKDEKGNIIKVYEYTVHREGLMSRVHAYKILKGLNPEAYGHWFRHSLATQLAEEGFTAHELKDWFDWSRYSTAQSYVEGMPSMTERISKRKVG